MYQALKHLKTNLIAGLRLALFRPCQIGDFIINSDQLVLLLAFDLILEITVEYYLALPKPEFNLYALPIHSFGDVIFFLQAFILTKLWKKPGLFLSVSILTISLTPILSALVYWDKHIKVVAETDPSSHYHWWSLIISILLLAISGRAFYMASGRLKSFTAAMLASLTIVGIIQFKYYGESENLWYSTEEEENAELETDRWKAYRDMDGETLMYSQPKLLNTTLQALKPERKQQSDIFFIGFAPYATEDVFSKEVTVAKNLFDTKFATEGHSINLINHLSTRTSIPLANASNLAESLLKIGKLMDKDDDVLMIYLTSHGSKDHKLSVSFWPLPLNNITPDKLRAMLDEAGIKWRVIMISACYSGGFINALQNDETLIATASAADKRSFGCGTESEFTYFGEALFKDLLPHEDSFLGAFEKVGGLIDKREKLEKVQQPSLPQLSVGKSIKPMLERLSKQIQAQQCGGKSCPEPDKTALLPK